jgi:hypothetical protein
MDAVALLREALDPELVRMGEIAQKLLPSLDGTTIGCLLSLYGIEISLCYGQVSPASGPNPFDAILQIGPSRPRCWRNKPAL